MAALRNGSPAMPSLLHNLMQGVNPFQMMLNPQIPTSSANINAAQAANQMLQQAGKIERIDNRLNPPNAAPSGYRTNDQLIGPDHAVEEMATRRTTSTRAGATAGAGDDHLASDGGRTGESAVERAARGRTAKVHAQRGPPVLRTGTGAFAADLKVAVPRVEALSQMPLNFQNQVHLVKRM